MRSQAKVAGAFLWAASLLTTTTLLAQEELPSPPPVAKPTPQASKPAEAAKTTTPKATAPKTAAKAPAHKAAAPRPAAPQPAPPVAGPAIVVPGAGGPIVIGPFVPPPVLSLRRDLPPEVRARRERLRAMTAQALDAFLPPDGDGPAVRPFAAALLGDGLIESMTVKIDPAGTNLKEDKVKLDSVANLRQTPWAGEPSRFTSQMSVKIGADEAGATMAAVDGKIQFQTQTVPLVNYALAQYKIRAAEQAAKPHEGPMTTDDVLINRINAKLQTIDGIRSIDEVGDLMNQMAEIRLSVVNEQIEGLRAALAKAPDDEARKQINADLTAVRVKRDRLLEARSKTTRDKNGVAQSIALKLAMLDLIPGADMQTLDVTLTNNEITATIVGNVYQYVDFYPLARPLVISTLERIQAGDPQAVETMRRAINVYLSQGLKPLLPEGQAAEATPAPAPGPTPAPPAADSPFPPPAAPAKPAPQPEALPTP